MLDFRPILRDTASVTALALVIPAAAAPWGTAVAAGAVVGWLHFASTGWLVERYVGAVRDGESGGIFQVNLLLGGVILLAVMGGLFGTLGAGPVMSGYALTLAIFTARLLWASVRSPAASTPVEQA